MEARNLEVAGTEATVAGLYGQCRTLLRGLDELGLHQAAAHVSMALDVMSRSLPGLAASTGIRG